MERNNEFSSISLKTETVEKLKTIKSCYQIARKKAINYDELINRLIEAGFEKFDPKVHKIYQLSIEEETDEETGGNTPAETDDSETEESVEGEN